MVLQPTMNIIVSITVIMLIILGSKSQRLLLFRMKVEMFGHFVKEKGGLDTVEIKDGESIDPIIK